MNTAVAPGSPESASGVAGSLVQQAKALASKLSKRTAPLNTTGSSNGPSLSHLKILTRHFADLAELTTRLEGQNAGLKSSLTKSSREVEKLTLENNALKRKLKVAEASKNKHEKTLSALSAAKERNGKLQAALKQYTDKALQVSKRARQGEKMVIKLQKLCTHLVQELREASSLNSPNGSVYPNSATPQALYEGGFRDVPHFERYMDQMKERKQIREDMRQKSRAAKKLPVAGTPPSGDSVDKGGVETGTGGGETKVAAETGMEEEGGGSGRR